MSPSLQCISTPPRLGTWAGLFCSADCEPLALVRPSLLARILILCCLVTSYPLEALVLLRLGLSSELCDPDSSWSTGLSRRFLGFVSRLPLGLPRPRLTWTWSSPAIFESGGGFFLRRDNFSSIASVPLDLPCGMILLRSSSCSSSDKCLSDWPLRQKVPRGARSL